MGLLDPTLPPYDPLEWEKKPFAERARMVCHSWAMQGYGTPLAIYVAYLLKIVLRESLSYEDVHRDVLSTMPGVSKLASSFSIRTVKMG